MNKFLFCKKCLCTFIVFIGHCNIMPARKGKHIAKQLYGDRTKGQPSNDIPSKKIKGILSLFYYV